MGNNSLTINTTKETADLGFSYKTVLSIKNINKIVIESPHVDYTTILNHVDSVKEILIDLAIKNIIC